MPGPPQHRLGDDAFCPACAHGCPVCPHPVKGPAIMGSPNVFVNKMMAMRVGDPGLHMVCCDGNNWKVASGSGTVFINNKPAARIGDSTSHCGGSGKVIKGSPNVFTGG
jgi:uncharacterized Zn-binding protein involved in type VI secretion